MANTDAPFGFQPFGALRDGDCHLYRLTNNYGTALYINDPVKVVAAGTLEIALVTAVISCVGTIVAVFKQDGPKTTRPENLTPVNYFAATPGTTYDYWALVADNPHLEFRVQEDGVTTPIAAIDVGSNVDAIFTHGGNTASGISGAEIDSNTMAATATLFCKLMRLAEEWDVKAGAWNAIGAYAKWIVRINNHQLISSTGI